MDPIGILGFFICVVLWATFCVLLIQNRPALDSIWRSYRRQPVALQGVEGVVLLPWAVGLAIWETRWASWLRVVVIGALAWANLYTFFPWKSLLGGS
jgi:hypothetical protein